MNDDLKNLIDKHILTGVSLILIAVVGWVGLSVTESRESIVALQTETRNVITIVDELKLEVRIERADRYTKTDSVRDLSVISDRITGLTRRVENLEKKLYSNN